MKTLTTFFMLFAAATLFAATEKELLFIRQFVKPEGLVFDVGAHKGLKTDLYLQLKAKVVCIEPQPECVKFLKRKYLRNPRVSIVNKGLSDKIGSLELYICSAAPTISTFSEKWQEGRFSGYSWDHTVVVPTTTLDLLIKDFGCPDFCKIDVEGFEYQVLKGLSSPIPYLSFEFAQEFFENSQLCIQHLHDLGYKFFNYATGENLEMTHEKWISAEKLIEELKTNPDPLLWGDIYACYVDEKL